MDALKSRDLDFLKLREQELHKAGAPKDLNTSDTRSKHPILYIQKGWGWFWEVANLSTNPAQQYKLVFRANISVGDPLVDE